MHVFAVNPDVAFCQFRRAEGNFFQQTFKNRMQTARANIFRARVHLRGDFRQRGNRIIGEMPN